jgi:hypothetical protein
MSGRQETRGKTSSHPIRRVLDGRTLTLAKPSDPGVRRRTRIRIRVQRNPARPRIDPPQISEPAKDTTVRSTVETDIQQRSALARTTAGSNAHLLPADPQPSPTLRP